MSILQGGATSSTAAEAFYSHTIDQSLRFNNDDSAYLNTQDSGDSADRYKWTASFWVKRGDLGSNYRLFATQMVASPYNGIDVKFTSGDQLSFLEYAGVGGYYWGITTYQVFRDYSAWYHIVISIDTTQSVAANRARLWINGRQLSDSELYQSTNAATKYPTLNYEEPLNRRSNRYISHPTGEFYDGYMAEWHYIDNGSYTADDFGEWKNDIWVPKADIATTLTYGTNGFYLPFENNTYLHSITRGGSIAHSTDASKVGGSSIEFVNGNSDFLTIPYAPDLHLGDTDWTIETWLYRSSNTNTYPVIYSHGYRSGASNRSLIIYYDTTSSTIHIAQSTAGTNNSDVSVTGTSITADTWTHLAVVRNGDTITVYLDGTAAGTTPALSLHNAPSENIFIGVQGDLPSNTYFLGYMDEFRVSRTARYTSSFTPSTTAFASDSNTALLIHSDTTDGSTTFVDDSGVVGGFTEDQSGNANDWTANNVIYSDVVPDSPTNNFATFNPLHSGGNMYRREGNLAYAGGGTNWYTALVTQGITSGKWYAEFYYERNGAGYAFVGVAKIAQPITINAYLGESAIGDADSYGYYSLNGYIFNQGVQTAYGNSYTDGDVIGLALDMDAGNLYFYKNGVAQNSGTAAVTGLTGTMYIGATSYSPSDIIHFNAGQDSTFAGQTTAGGNSDANGIGDFKYGVPDGYLALCTSNLPDPVIDPAQDMYASNNFDVVPYVGNGASQLIGDVVREVPDTYPISNSLRFDVASDTVLSRTPSAAGDQKTWTYSGWFKRGKTPFPDYAALLHVQDGSWSSGITMGGDGNLLGVAYYQGAWYVEMRSGNDLNDPAEWYHFTLAYDSTQATESDRVKLWVNGVRVTNWSNELYPSLNGATHINSALTHTIGAISTTGGYEFDGYMAELHFIDGTAYDATDFGAFDGDGIWYPITPSVTYGSNGFYLDFADSADIGKDVSGNGNHFTTHNLSSHDVVIDTPTNSICTLDPTSSVLSGGTTLSEGNLYFGDTSSSGASWYKGTQQVKSGKWYFEGLNVAQVNGLYLGWQQYDGTPVVGVTQTGTAVYMQSGYSTILYTDQYSQNNSISGSPSANTTGDVYQVAIDVDTGKVWFGVNNTWAGDPAAGTGYASILSDATKGVRPLLGAIGGGSYQYIHLNFGQDSTFSGAKTAGGNADGNGVGDFQYAPPTGFLALAENNIVNDTTNVESPDLVWIKTRSSAVDHRIYDSIRDVNQALRTNTTNAEATESNSLTGFYKNGFTIGDYAANNTAGSDYVAWMWKGGTQATNTNGSITSTVSANTDAGFSIVSYTGAGTGTSTVGHGLTQAPEMFIIKTRTGTTGWVTYHKGVASDAETDYLYLNTTAAAADSALPWADTAPTSSVFTVDGFSAVNGAQDFIAYCFHSVDGFSKVGSYKGNGNANGAFIYTGFRPKWVMVKRSSGTGSWRIWDAERVGYNIHNYYLDADSSNAEVAATGDIDMLSNGFKLRDVDTAHNASGATYIYLAFAEQPFKYSNAR